VKKQHLIIKALISLLAILAACQSQTNILPTQTPLAGEQEWVFESGARSTGKVVPNSIINLSFPYSGQIIKLLVQEGDLVKAGDIIAWQDTTALEASIQEAESALFTAQADLEKVLAGPHPALIKEAQSRATAAAAIVPLTNLQATAQAADLAAVQAQLDYLAAQPLPEDVAIAKAQVEQAKISLEIAQDRLNSTVMNAPVDGTILQIFIQAYEYAAVSETVVQISDLTQLKIEVPMDDLEVVDLELGDPGIVSFEALPELEVEAIISGIKPNDDKEQAGDFIVTLQLKQIPEGARWGMSAEVYFPAK
jgi:multidrug efflux pump subunit AcrA (membrane-fusion protein)